jgi:hypothetical protein
MGIVGILDSQTSSSLPEIRPCRGRESVREWRPFKVHRRCNAKTSNDDEALEIARLSIEALATLESLTSFQGQCDGFKL